jgi:hypothetical protein
VALSEAGLVKMELVAHDGTKIRAQAGIDSFRREETLREKLSQARRVVEEDPNGEVGNKRQQAAQQRARPVRRNVRANPTRFRRERRSQESPG